MPALKIGRWETQRDGPLREKTLRAKLESLGYRVNRYDYPAGTYFPDHTHDIDKIDAVLAGRFRIVLEGQEAILGPGDWIEVPRNAVHSAEVLGDVPVISLDAVRGS